jgi:GTP-binding protein
MFHDRARIHVAAGRGGDGGLTFRREKHVPKGGPDGGDGGPGGSVVLVADAGLRDLSNFRPNQWIKAGRGGSGRGALKHGATGADAELRVPVGTQVFDDGEQLLADLAHPGARVVVARGGSPGKGNKRFATPTRQAPRFAETGLPGDELWIELRLKLLADAALVGFPNAGKSSLIRRISNAKPKVAEYPFTTLAPVLGTVSSPDGERQLTVADVPGLIEGASEGVGLGHEFLAHLERAQMLLHVIDVTEDLAERFHAIDRELAQYGAGLDELPQIIVLNKVDLLPSPPSLLLDDERIVGTFAVSAATGQGVEQLKRALFELIPALSDSVATESEIPDFLVYRPRPKRERRYRIFRTDRGFRIEGTPPEDEEELDAALRSAGARAGDTVEVAGETMELL